MSEDDHVAYVIAHWRVTEDGLAWVPCGPDCTHERQPAVTWSTPDLDRSAGRSDRMGR